MDLRSIAVELVDNRHRYTVEFAPSPEAHRQEYDELERHLARMQPGSYLSIGFGDDEASMRRYATPFTLPRCESRRREGKRSWRCAKAYEHPGRHSSGPGGGRSW